MTKKLLIKAFEDAFFKLTEQKLLQEGKDVPIKIFPDVSILHFSTGLRGAIFAKIVLTKEDGINSIKVIFRHDGTNGVFPFVKDADKLTAILFLCENKILPDLAEISVACSSLIRLPLDAIEEAFVGGCN